MTKSMRIGLAFEPVSHHVCVCGEGPLWDNVHKRLYWIDIVQGEIHCYSPESRQLRHFSAGQKIGAIALSDSGCLITALKDGIYKASFEETTMVKLFDLEPDKPDNRCNDGKCDPAGRFWVGTMSDKGEVGEGSLYTVETNGMFSAKLQKLSISNGLAGDRDSGKFYHIDTPTGRIMAYDYCNESGAINGGHPVIEIDKTEGVPDGMTIDEEGKLWVAHWNGGRISRWDPNTSAKLQELFLPVSKVTSCTFGGDHMDDLYVTTAKIGLSNQELLNQPLAGVTFVFKNIGIRGVPDARVTDGGFAAEANQNIAMF